MLGARVDAACKTMMVTWNGERLDGCLEIQTRGWQWGTQREMVDTGRKGIYDHSRLRLRPSQGGARE